jgi:hypothetical protein
VNFDFLQLDCCDTERRADGSVLVRVRSGERQGRKLPDAVFTFRDGDPQYHYWEQRSRDVELCPQF